MGRVSVLLCFVLLVVIMVSVSFAENNEVKSTDLKKVKGQETDQSITKVNDDGEDDDHDHDHDNDNDDDHDNNHDHDHDNDDDSDHDHDNDDDGDHDHDNDDDGDHDYDNDHDDDNDHDNDNEDDDNDKDDHDGDGDNDDGDNDDGDDGDDEDDEKETLGIYELKKGSLTVKFTNRGASIISLLFPDKNGKMEDVVLGYDRVNEYMNDTVIFGATVGRVAHRREKTVAKDAKNTIHGGKNAIWRVMKHRNTGKNPYIVFTYTSPDGDQGKLDVTTTYKLVGENQLKMVMEAKAREKATPVNLVHRSYWNLGGHNNGDILSEEIQILGSGYAHVDDNLTPTGKILSVKGTSYDFLKLRPIKDNINEIKPGNGINYYLDGVANQMRKVVVLVDKKSKRKMELSTDQSGLKFYTGGNLKTMKGKNGSVYKAYSGLCLETHSFSRAINNQYLPSQIVKPGKKYKHTMLFKFSIVP